MSIFENYSAERRYSGRVAVGSAGVLLGRISFFDEGYTEGSILCVCGRERIDRNTLSLCPPIAVIVACGESSESLGELCALGVPCIVVEQESAIGRECKNKVALIDTDRGILALEPSLDTLNFYSSEKGRGDAYDLGCAIGYALREKDESLRRLEYEHYLVPCEALCKGEGLFENAIALWEQGCPELMTVDMRAPSESEGEARIFADRIEELFRASLYGSFALALSDFSCEEQISRALKILHKEFCLLEAEGREFNGYIPRGLVLSAPLWLMRASPVTNPDFIILDIDRLLPAIFCLGAEEIIKKEKVLQKELFSLLERYFINFMPRCELAVKSEAFFGTRLLQNLVAFADIKLVYR